MANLLYSTENYEALSIGGGVLLRQAATQKEVFIRGKDAQSKMLDIIEAIEDEVPENKQDVLFDLMAQEYF